MKGKSFINPLALVHPNRHNKLCPKKCEETLQKEPSSFHTEETFLRIQFTWQEIVVTLYS